MSVHTVQLMKDWHFSDGGGLRNNYRRFAGVGRIVLRKIVENTRNL
ncbi:hypothetical protein KUV22_14295 [Microbulbifer agarilyticus]|nr:hypothetical protein [Microbulbifer agarilyticus]MBY6191600.1 hypothetical protein [Microbulbifer agarilyticus]